MVAVDIGPDLTMTYVTLLCLIIVLGLVSYMLKNDITVMTTKTKVAMRVGRIVSFFQNTIICIRAMYTCISSCPEGQRMTAYGYT